MMVAIAGLKEWNFTHYACLLDGDRAGFNELVYYGIMRRNTLSFVRRF